MGLHGFPWDYMELGWVRARPNSATRFGKKLPNLQKSAKMGKHGFLGVPLASMEFHGVPWGSMGLG